MFDMSALVRAYDDLTAAGIPPISFALCDKRVLLPMERLPEFVERETGEVLETDRIPALVAAGWLPDLPHEDGGRGFAFYAPSRVGLLLRLERDGWTPAELTAAAEAEEHLIDEILVAPDTPYEDNDLLVVRIGVTDEVEMLQHQLNSSRADEATSGGAGHGASDDADLRARLEHAERTLAWLSSPSTTLEGMAAATRAKVARHAYVLRATWEGTRAWMLQQDRALLEAGFSFFVSTCEASWDADRSPKWQFTGVRWPETLRDHAAIGGMDSPVPIRVPGLVLLGERITLAPRTTPATYDAHWRTYELDTYLALVAERAGRRVCERCLAELPPGTATARRFCSEACRNAEKAEAYRRRHPERVKAAQHRWRGA